MALHMNIHHSSTETSLVDAEVVPLQTLILASTLGRSSRFFLVASAVYYFGPEVRKFLDTRLELVTLILFTLLILGFVAIKTLMH